MHLDLTVVNTMVKCQQSLTATQSCHCSPHPLILGPGKWPQQTYLLPCRGTDSFSFEIPADQPSKPDANQSPHPEHAVQLQANESPGAAPGPPSTPGHTLTPQGHPSSQGFSHTPGQPVSAQPADTGAAHQQLLQLQQMAADAGLLLVPNAQTPNTPHHLLKSLHDQQIWQQGHPQAQPMNGHPGIHSFNPQVANGPQPQQTAHAMSASTSHWQTSPGMHSQQLQQQATPGHAQHDLSAATFCPSPSFAAHQGQQPAHAQLGTSASPSHWQTGPGFHIHQQQQSRLPSWAQQALQQPGAVSNSPGFRPNDGSFAGQLPVGGSSLIGANAHATSVYSQHHQQESHTLASSPWLHITQQQLDGYTQHMSHAASAAHGMQPNVALSQAWDIPAHESGQSAASAASWTGTQQSGLEGQGRPTADAWAAGQGPALGQGRLLGQQGNGEGQAASAWQHSHAGQPANAWQASVVAVNCFRLCSACRLEYIAAVQGL